MNRKFIVFSVGAGALITAAAIVIGFGLPRELPEASHAKIITSEDKTAGNTSPKPNPATIRYSDSGFKTPELTIKEGETVTFINERPNRPMWIASNNHPEHLLYPEFDQGRVLGYEPLPKDNTFTFTFTKRGNWKYHDHYDAAREGVIIVN